MSLPSPGVVLDAATLFPASLRDTLLRLAEAGLYQPYWTNDILEEVQRNLIVDKKLSEAQNRRLITILKRAFPAALLPRSRSAIGV